MIKRIIVNGLLLCLGFAVCRTVAVAQTGPGANAPPPVLSAQPAQTQIITAPQTGDETYRGSVPQGTASTTPIPLSLKDALDRGLKTNLGLLTSLESSQEVRAERYRALSGLLPKVTGQLSMTEQQLNLQALGFLFTFPPSLGFSAPHIIGPYSYQAALANANVPLFDYSAISNFRASRENLKASALSIKNARDLVVQAVGNAYLQIIADSARITATQAEIEADNAVYRNAVHRHDAGTAIGIDVLRSQVELKQRQQQLVAVTNQFEKDKLALSRIIGLPVGQDFTVADPSPSLPLEAISLKDALAKAYEHRPDFQAAQARVLAAQFSLRGAKAERYPTLTASGFYGDEGLRLLTNSHGVFQATGSIGFNIFDGGRIKADILESDAELKNRRNELENLRGQIDYDIRNALLDLKSAGDQVDVARSNVDLASQTLKQSRDRFTAGVTNTVEVVQAQQTVADANENLISAQYQYNLAKVSLARALGLAEEGIRAYFNQGP
ncbi:MAG: TolC family protein [Acidobacteriaceae bacterium]|nr:TolC family protein [Acidobacteriaceae bacterium]MBV9763742.1 TolC family protein [Acidobacteriaceae bacterium]